VNWPIKSALYQVESLILKSQERGWRFTFGVGMSAFYLKKEKKKEKWKASK
jgi:hypothetical protein